MKKRLSAFHQQTSRCCLVNEQAWLQASEVTSNVEEEEGFHWAKGVAKHGVQLITTSLPLSFHQTDIFTKGSGQYSNGTFSFIKLFLIGNYIHDLQGFFFFWSWKMWLKPQYLGIWWQHRTKDWIWKWRLHALLSVLHANNHVILGKPLLV